MAQLVEYLPSKHKALSLNPSTTKKKKKERKKRPERCPYEIPTPNIILSYPGSESKRLHVFPHLWKSFSIQIKTIL
jgi:hypothetical protein